MQGFCCHSLRMSQSPRKPADRVETTSVRVDKWLWAARFFKTRSLASAAVKGGKIEIDGHNAKPSTGVRAGQRLSITKGELHFEVDVHAVSEKRGPASQAEALYVETPQSIEQRRAAAAERRAAHLTMPRPIGRPDKKQRRQLRRFKTGE